MRIYLYTGSDKAKAVNQLALSAAGLQPATYLVLIGPPKEDTP
jgi:hypothetical protein